MKNNLILMSSILLSLSVVSCGQQPVKPVVLEEKAVVSDCPIGDTRHWHAWLDRYDVAQGQYRLNISGLIDLPSAGYELIWQMGIADRAYPPGQRLTLTAIKSEQGLSAQVITPTPVTFKQAVPFTAYRHVSIYCGDRLLVSIPDVGLSD